MQEKLLTKWDVAKLLQVSVKTVERHIKLGQLGVVRITPYCIRITPAQLDKYLRNRGGAQ